jgi:hypothetical protein
MLPEFAGGVLSFFMAQENSWKKTGIVVEYLRNIPCPMDVKQVIAVQDPKGGIGCEICRH